MKWLLIFFLFLISLPAYSENQEFTSEGYIVEVLRYKTPQPGCLYSLNGMEVIQKTDKGLLISVAPGSGDWGANGPVFLYLNSKWKDFAWGQGTSLDPFYAYYVGEYEYTTITGFDKTISAFQIFDYYFDPSPENKKIFQDLENKKPNFISRNGRVIRNPDKRLSAEEMAKASSMVTVIGDPDFYKNKQSE